MPRLHTLARRSAKREYRAATRPDPDTGQADLNNPTALREYWARQLEIAEALLREAVQADRDTEEVDESWRGRLPSSPHDSIQVVGWTRFDQGPEAFDCEPTSPYEENCLAEMERLEQSDLED